MSNPDDKTVPNGNPIQENHSSEADAVIKHKLGKDYNTIHKDTRKERQRKLTQTSDQNIIHIREEKSERISCLTNVFTKENLYSKLPITQWLPKYDTSCVVSDMIAGITVGLTVIPQGIAYAGVAGLPAQVIFPCKVSSVEFESMLNQSYIKISYSVLDTFRFLVWPLFSIYGMLCIHDIW